MNDRVVLVTGAAGNLGRAVAQVFRDDGARLVLVGRDTASLQRAFGDLDRTMFLAADITQPGQLQQQVGHALTQFGRIDVCCHIAGGFRMGEPGHETTASTWDFLMDLNARSLLNVSAAVVPGMLSQRAGKIVTVGAGAAAKGAANMGAYSASKAALVRLTESMSAELRDSGINVNCVLPSTIDTPENRAAMQKADAARWVAPRALAQVIFFLCSDAASAIHGAAIPVNGLSG